MTTREIITIAVIGTRQPSPEEAKLAEEVGRELAKNGVVLVCGGLGGVMEAACRGACLEGGLTIGILPGNEAKSANRYVQIPIVTGMGYARNAVLVKSAQAVIAVGGGYGTLSEIAYALDFKIPIVGLNTWSFSRNNRVDKSIIRVRNAKSAVNKALKLVKGK
ncbi:MAG: TIGR00725 family protein [Chloroflexi bacterium]|nr:TIGR00725 family protein [Chloroflexota bacterium]